MQNVPAAAFFALTVLAAALPAWAGPPAMSTPESGDGRKYLDALSGMIERADKIVVSEHSDHWDLATKSGDKPIYPDLFYRGVALSEQQKSLFAGIVAKLDPKTQDMFAACIFEAHHTIRFFEQETLLSTMDVCFQCGEVEWNGSAATPPWSLYGGLARLIKGIGLEPERDWRALAKEHLSARNAAH